MRPYWTGGSGHYRNISLANRVVQGLDTVLLLGGWVTGYKRNGLLVLGPMILIKF